MNKETETMLVVSRDAWTAAKIGCAITGEAQKDFVSRVIIEAVNKAERPLVTITLPTKKKKARR